ncbi:MAG: DUF5103 domain-containing protein [Bacteroidales bacterium]|jgi:hypothetical protein|nr:DUF5103 domain-containing protein [Bacteroidales bacterium]
MKKLLILLSAILWLTQGFTSTSADGGFFRSVTVTPASRAIELGGSEALQIGFDDLTEAPYTLRYRLIYCNPDWSPSELKQQEYATGINEAEIHSSELSFNTRVNYVHHSFSIPDQYVSPRISGNYIAQIYDADNSEKILLEVPFRVYENKTQFNVQINSPRRVEYSRTRQELSINANVDPSISIQNTQNILLLVQQNYNPRTTRNIPLNYSNGNNLIFELNDALTFYGINEFRNFDIRPLTYTARGVMRNEIFENLRHIDLYTDKSYHGAEYSDRDDINGRYVIKAAGQSNSDVEADYAMVHFFLSSPYIPNAEVYVMGDFTAWQTSSEYLMKYDAARAEYILEILLKQGFYDYTYDVRTGNSDDFIHFENTYYDTENDYFLFLYYRRPGDANYRLIGYNVTNSRNK